MGNSEIKTVRDAIVRLGFRTIRSWTLVAASRAVILGGRKSEVLNSIWEKSVSTAIACQVAADISGLCNREVAFTGGLMQNLGQLVLARALPDQYKKIFESANKQGEPVHAIEKTTFGFDHGDLGGCLIDRWHLNPELAGAVKLHHAGYEEEVPELARLIALGEELAEVRDNTLEVVEVKHAISENAKILNIDVDTWTKMWEELSTIDVEC
jgi:HD-like signal output (HDOD) protein